MMPELGKYATAVYGSYLSTLVLMAALLVFVVWRNSKARRALEQIEGSKKHG